MRELLVVLADGAQLVARCLFWVMAVAVLAWLACALLAEAHARWHE